MQTYSYSYFIKLDTSAVFKIINHSDCIQCPVNDWNHINDSCYYDSKYRVPPDGSILSLEHQALY